MISKIPFLVAIIIAVGGSFLQSPDQFQSTFNSTFLKENDKLFKPIIIPNVTKSSEQPPPSQNEVVAKNTLKPKEASAIRENYLSEEPNTTGSSFKFSSRYSTKSEMREDLSSETKDEKSGEDVLETEQSHAENATAEVPIKKDEVSPTVKHKSFADRSVDGEEDTLKYDTNEPREAEQSEITSTTNEPYRELQRPTSFRNTPYSDDDSDNYETTSTTEETDSSKQEEEVEGKRSVEDYHNSDSKYYHSIQTPINHVKYLGPHSYRGSFEPEKPRTRLVSPMSRQHAKPNWPYSRPKAKIEELNEISERDENHQKDLDEKVKEEVRGKPELELAVEKDEIKFDRSKKYNYVDERNRMRQKQKNLAAEEEKDDERPLFQSLKQYQVDEEPRHQPSGKIAKLKTNENIWSRKPVLTTPQNTTPDKKPKQSGVFNEVTPNFKGPQFLGPVVFTQHLEQQSIRPVAKLPPKHFTSQKVPIRNAIIKGLLEKEKLDQDNLTNQRIEKSIFRTGSQQSFNHLEESNEMYNAILANIQSVFGIKTQAFKSDAGDRKGTEGSAPDINLDESKTLTWSLPLIKRTKVN